MNYSPDDIIEAHPHLTLDQVHDALSYYYENSEEIDRQIAEGRKLVDGIKKFRIDFGEKTHRRLGFMWMRMLILPLLLEAEEMNNRLEFL